MNATLAIPDLETITRQENASREHDRFVLGEIPPATCDRWCRVNLLDDDAAEARGMQTMDEGFFADAVERGIEQLAEGPRDYLKSRRDRLESRETAEQVAVVREALRILRASRDQVAAKV